LVFCNPFQIPTSSLYAPRTCTRSAAAAVSHVRHGGQGWRSGGACSPHNCPLPCNPTHITAYGARENLNPHLAAFRPSKWQRLLHFWATITRAFACATPFLSLTSLPYPFHHRLMPLAQQVPLTFDLKWRALAVVLEGGTEGVDVDAVKAAFAATAPAQDEGRIIWCVASRCVADRKPLGTITTPRVSPSLARELPCIVTGKQPQTGRASWVARRRGGEAKFTKFNKITLAERFFLSFSRLFFPSLPLSDPDLTPPHAPTPPPPPTPKHNSYGAVSLEELTAAAESAEVGLYKLNPVDP
jgi:hypothetical protein